MNVILRPVFDRPEMLQLSIDYEIAARNYHMLKENLHTIFVVEYGAPQKILDLIDLYPFDHSVILRNEKFGLTKNILEGMKSAFELANDYIIYIEDDILIHKTYFKFMDVLLNMSNLGKYTILSAYNKTDDGDINEVYRGNHYCAWGALITKKFFMDYIIHCANDLYYINRNRFVKILGNEFNNNELYKYRNNPMQHNEQAGLINRLVDIAIIKTQSYVIMPKVNRQIHIGFYGKNRPGHLEGMTYEDRLINLKSMIEQNKFYEMSKAKMYNDYKIFDKRLENWDGMLYVK
jgi:hypothetical protein